MKSGREAVALYFHDGEQIIVGMPWANPSESPTKQSPPITKIVIDCDLPSQMAFMERAKVFVGKTLVWESPVANLEGIQYPVDE